MTRRLYARRDNRLRVRHEQNAHHLHAGRWHVVRAADVAVPRPRLLRAHRVQRHLVLAVPERAIFGVQHRADVAVLSHVRQLLQRVQVRTQQTTADDDDGKRWWRRRRPVRGQVSCVSQLHHVGRVRDRVVRQDRVDLLQ